MRLIFRVCLPDPQDFKHTAEVGNVTMFVLSNIYFIAFYNIRHTTLGTQRGWEMGIDGVRHRLLIFLMTQLEDHTSLVTTIYIGTST